MKTYEDKLNNQIHWLPKKTKLLTRWKTALSTLSPHRIKKKKRLLTTNKRFYVFVFHISPNNSNTTPGLSIIALSFLDELKLTTDAEFLN